MICAVSCDVGMWLPEPSRSSVSCKLRDSSQLVKVSHNLVRQNFTYRVSQAQRILIRPEALPPRRPKGDGPGRYVANTLSADAMWSVAAPLLIVIRPSAYLAFLALHLFLPDVIISVNSLPSAGYLSAQLWHTKPQAVLITRGSDAVEGKNNF